MPKWHANLKLEFIKLLKDDIDMVLEGLVPNISDILISFAASNTLTNDKAVSPALLFNNNTVNNWV